MATAKNSPRKKISPNPVTWTADEESLGRAIIYRARFCGSTGLSDKILNPAQKREKFLEAYGEAAKEHGYSRYVDLPEGTKRFISWLGGRNSHKHKPKEDVSPKDLPSSLKLEQEWWHGVLSNGDLRRARLHPEDDATLIDDLPRFLAEERAFGSF